MTEITYQSSDSCFLYATIIDRVGIQETVDDGSAVVLMHGGGPDHRSLIPLAQQLADLYRIVLPDVRGYGRSVCTDPASHTWWQYAKDVIGLLDYLGIQRAILGGAGLGTTISLRTAIAYPDRVKALVLISVEDIEDDEAKQIEIAFMDAFASRVRADGIEAGWEPILGDLAPVIGAMVREAIPRSDPASIAAAASIGHDRSFRSVDELEVITAPTLIFPGIDNRHPMALAESLACILPNGHLAPVRLTNDVHTADDFALVLGPTIRAFLQI